jgi:hypothetical protein
MAGKLTKFRKGRRPSLVSTKKNSEANQLQLECDLDFRHHNWKSVYCVRIANFLLEYATDRRPEPEIFRAHYLVLERASPLSLRRHPLDQGTFRRIGVGECSVKGADAFFKSVPRRFLTLV